VLCHQTHHLDAAVLSRFFSFIGFLATKLLIFHNQSFVCELKRRKMCKESKKDSDKSNNNNNNNKTQTANNKSKKRKSIRVSHNPDNGLEEEMEIKNELEKDHLNESINEYKTGFLLNFKRLSIKIFIFVNLI